MQFSIPTRHILETNFISGIDDYIRFSNDFTRNEEQQQKTHDVIFIA